MAYYCGQVFGKKLIRRRFLELSPNKYFGAKGRFLFPRLRPFMNVSRFYIYIYIFDLILWGAFWEGILVVLGGSSVPKPTSRKPWKLPSSVTQVPHLPTGRGMFFGWGEGMFWDRDPFFFLGNGGPSFSSTPTSRWRFWAPEPKGGLHSRCGFGLNVPLTRCFLAAYVGSFLVVCLIGAMLQFRNGGCPFRALISAVARIKPERRSHDVPPCKVSRTTCNKTSFLSFPAMTRTGATAAEKAFPCFLTSLKPTPRTGL